MMQTEEKAEEYEMRAFTKIAVLFLETHNVSYDEGCVFVETEENIRKWKAISMRMVYNPASGLIEGN